MGGQAAAIQGQLNFSRDMEREADRIGYACSASPASTVPAWPACSPSSDLANRLNDNGAYPYLRSHPLTLERQSEARLRLQGNPGHPRPSSTVDARGDERPRAGADGHQRAGAAQAAGAAGRAACGRARPTGWPRCTPARWRRAGCVTTRWLAAHTPPTAASCWPRSRARPVGATRAVAAGRRRPHWPPAEPAGSAGAAGPRCSSNGRPATGPEARR
jgi:hypothetical protein